MAHDLFFKNSKRDWSRNIQSVSDSGRIYADEIFSRRPVPNPIRTDDTEHPKIMVVEKNTGMGWLGYTLAAMFSTRILSGKWPWYWAGIAANKLESPHAHQKG